MNINNKITLGVIAAGVLVVIGYFLLRPVSPQPAQAPGTETATSTPSATLPKQPAKKPSEPEFTFGSTTVNTLSVDQKSLISTSSNPTITGTSNANKIGLVISDAKGVGIVGSFEIPVAKGKWAYSISVALAPGTYSVLVLGGTTDARTKLVVLAP